MTASHRRLAGLGNVRIYWDYDCRFDEFCVRVDRVTAMRNVTVRGPFMGNIVRTLAILRARAYRLLRADARLVNRP